MATIQQLLEAHSKFVNAVEALGAFDIVRRPLRASTAAEIAQLERALGVVVPADLRAFWEHGFENVSLCDGDAVIITETFVGAKGALESAEITRKIAGDYPPSDPVELRWAQSGIPFHEGEDPCFIDAGKGGDGSVFQRINDGDPLLDPVAKSFTEYFERWLGAGCYSYGKGDVKTFWKYWDRVRPCVPDPIEPGRNAWLLHHGKRYENPKFPGTGGAKKPKAR